MPMVQLPSFMTISALGACRRCMNISARAAILSSILLLTVFVANLGNVVVVPVLAITIAFCTLWCAHLIAFAKSEAMSSLTSQVNDSTSLPKYDRREVFLFMSGLVIGLLGTSLVPRLSLAAVPQAADRLAEYLKDVAQLNGTPLFYSPFGVKRFNEGGKTFLVALAPNERSDEPLSSRGWSSLELHQRHDLVGGVETKNGVPIILAPYGVRKELISGKIHLVAMTPDEQREFLDQLERSMRAAMVSAVLMGLAAGAGCPIAPDVHGEIVTFLRRAIALAS